jgi:hypothetical protein
MEKPKQMLAEAFAKGPRAKRFIDEILSSDKADPVCDLRAVFAVLDPGRLRLLRTGLACGDVITKAYHEHDPGGREKGCLYYWLLNVQSNRELLSRDSSSEDLLKAVCRSLRFWDYGVIDGNIVSTILDEVIARREEAEVGEFATTRRVIQSECAELETVATRFAP